MLDTSTLLLGQRGRPGQAFDGQSGRMGERGLVGQPGLRGYPGLRGVPGVCLTSGCALLNATANGPPQQLHEPTTQRAPQRVPQRATTRFRGRQ